MSQKTKKKVSQDDKKVPQRTNYTPDELELLERSVAKYSKLLFGKDPKVRKMAYIAVTKSINKASQTTRSVESVKNRIRSDIASAKTKQMLIRECMEKTGGGSFDAPELTTYEELLLSFIKEEQLTGIDGGIDTAKKESLTRFRPPFKKQKVECVLVSDTPATKKSWKCKENCDPQPSTSKQRSFPTASPKTPSPILKDQKRRRLLFGSEGNKDQLDTSEDFSQDEVAALSSDEEFENGLQVKIEEAELKIINSKEEVVHLIKDVNKGPLLESRETQTENVFVDKYDVFQQQENVVLALKNQTQAIENQTLVLGNISNFLQIFLGAKSVVTNADTQ